MARSRQWPSATQPGASLCPGDQPKHRDPVRPSPASSESLRPSSQSGPLGPVRPGPLPPDLSSSQPSLTRPAHF
ncbi:hypothetical protein CRG98_016080 [Punica granatum]|uniref:Uncharacterized protein n=1 Tax=Punica granatum TaxID=22663 RepID=A0A2I0K5J1_PUNGR|nr:hypothetical protein CRG98_016080 [Punica granatum]